MRALRPDLVNAYHPARKAYYQIPISLSHIRINPIIDSGNKIRKIQRNSLVNRSDTCVRKLQNELGQINPGGIANSGSRRNRTKIRIFSALPLTLVAAGKVMNISVDPMITESRNGRSLFREVS